MKTKQLMLLFDLLSKIFTALGLYFLSSMSGAYIFVVVFFMLIVANIKEQRNKKWWLGYALFQFVYLVILFKTYVGISSILVTLTSSIKLFSVWWLQSQGMRVMAGINSVIFLFYQLSIKNWAGLLEIIVMISNFAAFAKYRKKA